MHYVTVEGLGKSYGTRSLFTGLTFHIEEGDKIALIARNGSGKSTLLKILASQEPADEGKLWVHKDVKLAYLEQEPEFDESRSVIENIFNQPHPLVQATRDYELALEKNDPALIGTALTRMDELGAWDFDAKVKQVLGKLSIHNLDQPVSQLSGGEKKRVALARVLLDIGFEPRHVLLIMDEPTNHLDISMVEWLEYYLTKENISLVLVTHDRYFLDAVCGEIWELEGSELFSYKGNYANYLEKKTARLESRQASLEKAKNLYRRELEWMRKQPRARTTKSKSRQDNFQKVKAEASKRLEQDRLNLQLKMSRLGGKVAELKKVNKAFGNKVILKGFDYTFKKGDRIGIIGKNGSGKTTFLEMLQGTQQPDSGKINLGETVVSGHYTQQGLQLKEDLRVIEYVKTFAESFPLADGGSLSASQFLELFLFPPEQQFTFISRLSGGEKKRLQLLAMLFRNPNFLILDEPTNDLDLPTLQVLEQFLADFQGCLLLVSHDRYFMDRLVEHVFVFEGGGEVRDFPGNYTHYREWLEVQEELEMNRDSASVQEEIARPVKEKGRVSFKEKHEFEQLNKELERLNKRKKELGEQLSNTSLPYGELDQLSKDYQAVTESLDLMELRWLELSEKMEN